MYNVSRSNEISLLSSQILAVSCDNAENNNKMINRMDTLLPEFRGRLAHVMCFLHITNISATKTVRQFDITKGKGDGDIDKELAALGEDEDDDDDAQMDSQEAADGEGEEEDEEFDDLMDTMTAEEKIQHVKDVRMISLLLTKVRELEPLFLMFS
jgi:hypothetical protein